jgi:hypothetical protein
MAQGAFSISGIPKERSISIGFVFSLFIPARVTRPIGFLFSTGRAHPTLGFEA